MGSARGAGVHRARATACSTGQFSAGHAGPRYCAGRHQKRQAGTGHQRHRPSLHDAFDDPFATLNRELEACPLRAAADAIVVDFHCEATSEKQGIGFFCDGRASLVVGTHTHVPTADHQILSAGTAYMTDAGMTGDYDSIIGMQKEEPLRRFTSGIPSGRFEPAHGIATLSGVAVETDDSTGLALRVAPVRIGGRLEPTLPGFWV